MPNREMVTVEELAQAMEDRATFYRFLANALLHEFTVEQIEQLRRLDALAIDSEEAQDALAKAKRYLAHAGADPRTDLAVDYARIFLSAGVHEGFTAEPYESVFTSEERLMMQDARDDVLAFYRSNGVDVDPALHMPEDHLGLEFEFLAVMAGKTADALRAADAEEGGDFARAAEMVLVQHDFASRHILNWIDGLAAKVDEFARLPLYPALMRIAKAYVEADVHLLEEVHGALR